MIRQNNIDVLRAISVVMVFLYHSEYEIFSSFFFGVDIFLLITGYLTADALTRYTPFTFLLARYFRIFPTLLVFLLITIFIFSLNMYHFELRHFFQQAVSAIGFGTNFLLLMQKGYFNNSVQSIPFFHLWSISLEFQIWVIFAILAFFSRYKTIFIVGVCSFCAAMYTIFYIGSIDSFYLSPFLRFWEPCIGFALHGCKSNLRGRLIFLIVPALILLLAIDLRHFPAIWIVLVGVFAVLIRVDVIGSSLVHKLFEFISARTFSVYLYHVPILILSNYYFDGIFHFLLSAFLTLAVADLSYRYLERRRDTPKFSLIIGLQIFAGFVLILSYYNYEKISIIDERADSDAPYVTQSNCPITYFPGYCRMNSNQETDDFTLIFGDSLGLVWADAYENLDYNYLYLGAGSCPFVDYDFEFSNANCDLLKEIIEEWLFQNNYNIDHILYVSNLNAYAEVVGEKLISELIADRLISMSKMVQSPEVTIILPQNKLTTPLSECLPRLFKSENNCSLDLNSRFSYQSLRDDPYKFNVIAPEKNVILSEYVLEFKDSLHLNLLGLEKFYDGI